MKKLLLIPAAAALIVAGAAWWSTSSNLDSQLAQLRARGLPTTASEVNEYYAIPEGVPDATKEWVAAIDAVVNANAPSRMKDLAVYGNGDVIPGEGEEWRNLAQAITVRNELNAIIDLAHSAARAGGAARFPTDFSQGIETELFHALHARELCRLLVFDAHVSAQAAEKSRVHNDLLAIFALSEALRLEPCALSQLVRIAIYVSGLHALEQFISHGEWSGADLGDLQASAAQADFHSGFFRAISGERAIFLTTTDRLPIGPLALTTQRRSLELFEIVASAEGETWMTTFGRMAEFDREVNRSRNGQPLRLLHVGLFVLPAIEHFFVASARTAARQRCAIAALAAKRFHLQHDRWPDALADIPDKLFGPYADRADRIADPFTGEPLQLISDDERFLVYSVGDNQIDDGGRLEIDSHNPMDFDVGFRLQKH